MCDRNLEDWVQEIGNRSSWSRDGHGRLISINRVYIPEEVEASLQSIIPIRFTGRNGVATVWLRTWAMFRTAGEAKEQAMAKSLDVWEGQEPSWVD